MELPLLCQGLLIIISVRSISSVSNHRGVNKDLLDDNKSLNLSRHFGRFQLFNDSSLSNSRENGATGIRQLHVIADKPNSKDSFPEKKFKGQDTIIDLKDFNKRFSDEKQRIAKTHMEAHKENIQEKETTEAESDGKEYAHGNQVDEPLSKKEAKEIADINKDEGQETFNINETEQEGKEKLKEDLREREQEIEADATDDKTTIKVYPSSTRRTEIPLQKTTERSIKHKKNHTSHNAQIHDKKYAIHMKEKNRHVIPFHKHRENVKHAFKPKSKLNPADETRKTEILKIPTISGLPVTKKSNIFIVSEMTDSKHLFVTVHDKQQEHSPDEMKEATLSGGESITTAYSTAKKPQLQSQQTKSSQYHETVDLKSSLKPKLTRGFQVRNKHERKNTHSSAGRYTTSITTSKKKNGALVSFKNTEMASKIVRNVTPNTNGHTLIRITKRSSRTTSQGTEVKSNKNNFDSENNLDENGEDDNLLVGPCKDAEALSKKYNGSALIAASVGGVFIGACAVFLLFHLKQKCKMYVNGDYRRVPMEYDFELNPRFKSH